MRRAAVSRCATSTLILPLSGSLALTLLLLMGPTRAHAEPGYDDDRIMLQGFYWESYRHGHTDRFPQHGPDHWYTIVKRNAGAIRDGHFDLVWLPPPCYSGDLSAGYGPKEYFKLANSYGSDAEHKDMLRALLDAGVEPLADLVLNHRDGTGGWATFKNPDWGLWAVCSTDDCFWKDESGLKNTPDDQKGAAEEKRAYRGYDNHSYDVFRDIDHTNKGVRRDILKYLLMLKSAGYRGWRYDMVHGFSARWLAVYNRHTGPTFSVGEYDWDKHEQQRGWIYESATTKGDLRTASNVFDFTTKHTLAANKSNYAAWYAYGNGLGMMGDSTDGLPWKNRAVTFLENHDTGYRTEEDGTPEKHHYHDSFANTWEVEQGYAYILTHPGIPCVYWKHYFDWGGDLQNKIKALANARKVAGVKSSSAIHTQKNAQAAGVYAALVEGSNGAKLYVRVGGSDASWTPATSGYTDYRDYAHGAGWAVWLHLPGNPPVQQAAAHPGFPVPAFVEAKDIAIPDAWLNETE